MCSMDPVIAIVGRPNVGKSTLFNRLTRSRDALVDDRPGVTRDRLCAQVSYDDRSFSIIDTGGFEDFTGDPLAQKIQEQIKWAIEEADAIIFMVDGRQGLLPTDEQIARMLRPFEKKVYLAVNKIDGPELEYLAAEFYGLGFPLLFPISAAHGFGVKALIERLLEDLPSYPEEEEGQADRIRVAVVGKPNVGKSSLINRILGSERLVVSEIPGTTRDSVDTHLRWYGRDYTLIDTAGIRRKARVREKIEKFSVIKALRSLDRCHVACVLIDAWQGASEQDARICGYALERGKAVVVVLNKWDLVRDNETKRRYLENSLEMQLGFLDFAPKVRTSAVTGQGIGRLFQYIDQAYGQFSSSVKTSDLNRVLKEIVAKHPPAIVGHKRPNFSYATQVDIKPPTFLIFVNRPEWIQRNYERYLLNQLRSRLGLTLTPIRIIFRKKK